MTSSQWPETRDGMFLTHMLLFSIVINSDVSVGGILSPLPDENPFWWNANHVFVPYCTSDSWSGTRMTREGMFSFMGARVVQQVRTQIYKHTLPISKSTI